MTDAALARMPADRRRHLLVVAADEFAQAGYERASLNRIIRTVGMSKSSFYHVIESKRGLFDLVVDELGAAVLAELEVPEPAAFAGEAFWPTVDALLADLAIASELEGAVALGRLFHLADGPADAATASAFSAIERWLHDVLAVGRASGAVRDDSPADLQLTVVVAVLKAVDEWALARLPAVDGMTLLRDQSGMLRRLLAPSEAGSLARDVP